MFSVSRPVLVLLAGVCLGWLASTAGAQQREPIPFSPEAVDKAIEKGTAYLWSIWNEKGATWDTPPAKPFPDNGNEGGYSSLAVLALLHCDHGCFTEARMKRSLEWLATVETNKTYVLGLRAQIWAMLPQDWVVLGNNPANPKARKITAHDLLMKDGFQLMKSVAGANFATKGRIPVAKGGAGGSYGYVSSGKPGGGDHSNSQYGVLGVSAAGSQNVEIPLQYWQLIFDHWSATQCNDGGWHYGHGQVDEHGAPIKGTPNMTAAGLASMFVAFDFLSADQFSKCGMNSMPPEIQKGLDWYDKNFKQAVDGTGYTFYGIERVGLASGYKYFGAQDWYKIIATRLINSQGGNGAWGDLVETTFRLLFLSRGRCPVLFNHLEYGPAGVNDWNNRPRALANLMRWTGRKFEREVAWQIINTQTNVEDWHDAPILLITGNKKPTFDAAELDKLRRYVHQGGMILSIAECGGGAFDTAMRVGKNNIYSQLFPDYEMRQLEVTHPIYSAHFDIKNPPRLFAVSNGSRILALHTTVDMPLPWQTNNYASNVRDYELAFNIVFFSTDRASLRQRGSDPWPPAKPFTPLRALKIARVKYNGNWNPEPLAMDRFALLMGLREQAKITVNDGVTLDQLNAAQWRLPHMTGNTAITLSDAEKQGLKQFVQAGGTLIIDAAGGSEAFADSIAKTLSDIFGEGSLQKLPAFSPVYSMKGMEITSVKYRREAKTKRVGDTTAPRLLTVNVGARPAVILSREDITSGLVGFNCWTCIGYTPESAFELMRNLVVFGNSGAVSAASAPAASEPAASAPGATPAPAEAK